MVKYYDSVWLLRYIFVWGFVKLEIILSRSADVIEPSKPWEAGLKLDEEKSLAFAALMHSLVALPHVVIHFRFSKKTMPKVLVPTDNAL